MFPLSNWWLKAGGCSPSIIIAVAVFVVAAVFVAFVLVFPVVLAVAPVSVPVPVVPIVIPVISVIIMIVPVIAVVGIIVPVILRFLVVAVVFLVVVGAERVVGEFTDGRACRGFCPDEAVCVILGDGGLSRGNTCAKDEAGCKDEGKW